METPQCKKPHTTTVFNSWPCPQSVVILDLLSTGLNRERPHGRIMPSTSRLRSHVCFTLLKTSVYILAYAFAKARPQRKLYFTLHMTLLKQHPSESCPSKIPPCQSNSPKQDPNTKAMLAKVIQARYSTKAYQSNPPEARSQHQSNSPKQNPSTKEILA